MRSHDVIGEAPWREIRLECSTSTPRREPGSNVTQSLLGERDKEVDFRRKGLPPVLLMVLDAPRGHACSGSQWQGLGDESAKIVELQGEPERFLMHVGVFAERIASKRGGVNGWEKIDFRYRE